MTQKVELTTIDEITNAITEGKEVYWLGKQSEVKKTRSGTVVVNTQINAHKWVTHKLGTVLKVRGVKDFYYEEEITNECSRA